jgi:hypothetical protein
VNGDALLRIDGWVTMSKYAGCILETASKRRRDFVIRYMTRPITMPTSVPNQEPVDDQPA